MIYLLSNECIIRFIWSESYYDNFCGHNDPQGCIFEYRLIPTAKRPPPLYLWYQFFFRYVIICLPNIPCAKIQWWPALNLTFWPITNVQILGQNSLRPGILPQGKPNFIKSDQSLPEVVKYYMKIDIFSSKNNFIKSSQI